MAQLVKCLTLDVGSGHDLRIMIEPLIRLPAEGGACLRFSLPLFLPLPHSHACARVHALSLSPSLSQNNKLKKKKRFPFFLYPSPLLTLMFSLSKTITTINKQTEFCNKNYIEFRTKTVIEKSKVNVQKQDKIYSNASQSTIGIAQSFMRQCGNFQRILIKEYFHTYLKCSISGNFTEILKQS